MSIFRKKEEDDEDIDEELEVKDLKPENKRKRKEVQKPWGKRERYIVLGFFLSTVLISSALAASSRSWKLPGLPQIKFPDFRQLNLDFWESEVITVGPGRGAVDPKEVEKAEKITTEFKEKTKNLSGVYSMQVINLESGYTFGVGEKDVFTAASLIKLPVIAAIYIEAEEGRINLDEKPEGSNFTFRDLAWEMGHRSNNVAQTIAVSALGEERIQEVIDTIGMGNTSYSQNKTTPWDVGLFFEKAWENEIISEKGRDEMLDFLTDTIYEDWIKKGIPDVRVAHKYGREVHVIHDAGIVFAQEPFVLVIMSEGVVDTEADVSIPVLASIVFRELK